MVLKVDWAPQAVADLQAIKEYILRDSKAYAELVVRDIHALGESLAEFPLSGRFVPEFPRARFRERMIYRYRLVYRVKRRSREIITVTHHARLLRFPGRKAR